MLIEGRKMQQVEEPSGLTKTLAIQSVMGGLELNIIR